MRKTIKRNKTKKLKNLKKKSKKHHGGYFPLRTLVRLGKGPFQKKYY